jgi:hypothetical protein
VEHHHGLGVIVSAHRDRVRPRTRPTDCIDRLCQRGTGVRLFAPLALQPDWHSWGEHIGFLCAPTAGLREAALRVDPETLAQHGGDFSLPPVPLDPAGFTHGRSSPRGERATTDARETPRA